MALRDALLSTWVLVSLALAAACSSSSMGAEGDGGGRPSNVISPLSDSGGVGQINASCGQLATVNGGVVSTCPMGQTCCTTLSLGTLSASSSCVAIGQCSGGISNECLGAANCATGNVCCSGAATSDAGMAGGTDGGSSGALNPTAFNTSCQTTCLPGQQQLCASDADCPSGMVCSAAAAPAGFGGMSSMGGGDGGPLAGIKTCARPLPDAGGSVSPSSDAAASDGATE